MGERRATFWRRMVLAFAAAFAIHEVIAALIPLHTASIQMAPTETITIAKLVHIERRPSPTPRPIVHAKIIAPTRVAPKIVNPGRPSMNEHHRRIASARPLVRTRFHAKPLPIHIPVGGHGAGTSVTAKVETGGVGTGGTGSGESGTGNGTGGAVAAQEPCGAVYFDPTDKATTDPATGRVWERIEIIVHFPDGSQQSIPLDYPFYYPSAAQDPFLPGHENIPALFQFPPPSQAGSEPDIVQYVIAHTYPDGFTKLRDCPQTG